MTSSDLVSAFALIFAITLPIHAHPFAPAPSPTSHGTSIDQGIAYLLMLLALVLTYIIHTTDTPLDLS